MRQLQVEPTALSLGEVGVPAQAGRSRVRMPIHDPHRQAQAFVVELETLRGVESERPVRIGLV